MTAAPPEVCACPAATHTKSHHEGSAAPMPFTVIPVSKEQDMKVIVDVDRCELHGECVMAAPEVFDIGDDDTVVRVLDPEPEEKHRAAVQDAALMCPLAAIRIEG